MALGLYKYHHVKNSYVVASSKAALEELPESFLLHTELADFVLLAHRLQAIVQYYKAPGSGMSKEQWQRSPVMMPRDSAKGPNEPLCRDLQTSKGMPC